MDEDAVDSQTLDVFCTPLTASTAAAGGHATPNSLGSRIFTERVREESKRSGGSLHSVAEWMFVDLEKNLMGGTASGHPGSLRLWLGRLAMWYFCVTDPLQLPIEV